MPSNKATPTAPNKPAPAAKPEINHCGMKLINACTASAP